MPIITIYLSGASGGEQELAETVAEAFGHHCLRT
jgi:phenylpyruvate tautomerase PptA (4-oxalocrotonate tautomerase family)